MPDSTIVPATAGRQPDLMPIEELRRATGWGRTTLYTKARLDDLPFPVLRHGRKLFVSRRAYERWLDGETSRPAEAE